MRLRASTIIPVLESGSVQLTDLPRIPSLTGLDGNPVHPHPRPMLLALPITAPMGDPCSLPPLRDSRETSAPLGTTAQKV